MRVTDLRSSTTWTSLRSEVFQSHTSLKSVLHALDPKWLDVVAHAKKLLVTPFSPSRIGETIHAYTWGRWWIPGVPLVWLTLCNYSREVSRLISKPIAENVRKVGRYLVEGCSGLARISDVIRRKYRLSQQLPNPNGPAILCFVLYQYRYDFWFV